MDVAPTPALTPAVPVTARVGTALALVAAGLQVLAGFHLWRADTREVALDLTLVAGAPSLLSFGTTLLALAALPALAALLTSRGWPRLVSGIATAALVLGWVALGPTGAIAAGVWLATVAVVLHLLAAALAP